MQRPSTGESSTTSGGGSTASMSTGGPALPEWAIGAFSSESDQVGMSFMGTTHSWLNAEITATGTLFLDWYSCSVHRERQEFRWMSTEGGESLILQSVPPADVFEPRERQEFRWTLADDGQSLIIQTDPPSDVFTYGNGNPVSELIIEPGDSCDTLIVRYFHIEAMSWGMDEYIRGNVCTSATDPDACIFTFEWCNGAPPPACD